jgi:peroxiredoxin
VRSEGPTHPLGSIISRRWVFSSPRAGRLPLAPAGVPIEVNAAAPKFVAKEVDGRAFQFDPASLRQPTLIIFYRGGWCPYCNAQLQDLHMVVPQIVAMGYQFLFLSTDQPRLLYSSLKEKVDYHLLSDSSMDAAHAFGGF